MRIRWQGLGKAAAVAIGGLAALLALPGLLRPPEPPPPAADVGLPRVEVRGAEPAPGARARFVPKPPKRRRTDLSTPHRAKKLGSAEKPDSNPPSAPPSTPPPAPTPAPPPPAPSSPPSPPVAPPSDGSLEFMPH